MRNKTTAAKAASAKVNNALGLIPSAAFSYARNKAALIGLIKVTGATKEARHNFIVGHIAQAMNPKAESLTPAMLLKAETVVKAKGKDAKGKVAKGQARRTEPQERAYGAARKAWHLIVKASGVEAADNRGGANNTGKVKTGSNESDKVETAKPEATPKAVDRESAIEYVRQTGVTALAYVNKNAKVVPLDYATIVKKFHADIMAITAK